MATKPIKNLPPKLYIWLKTVTRHFCKRSYIIMCTAKTVVVNFQFPNWQSMTNLSCHSNQNIRTKAMFLKSFLEYLCKVSTFSALYLLMGWFVKRLPFFVVWLQWQPNPGRSWHHKFVRCSTILGYLGTHKHFCMLKLFC